MSYSQFDISKFNFADERKDLVTFARVAETAERYDDMCQFLKTLVKKVKSGDLTVEERNLLSVAYKNLVGSRRAAWRSLNVDEFRDSPSMATYKSIVEGELEAACKEVLDLLLVHLVPLTEGSKGEGAVFYLKMAGDYNRYLAEFIPGKGYDTESAKNYQKALEIAQSNLPATHPIRLGLALNYSVCYYEILKDHKKACELAKQAFDEAISKLDQLDEASYKDSTLIMQLLRDNLTLWTSDSADDK